MDFAIYSRKSKQTGKGESIQNQIEYCQNYIACHFGKQHHITVFSEEGYSAKNSCRPQFQKMLSLAQQKKLDYIVCYRLDRISRNVGDFALLLQQLSAWNVSFICVQQQFDTATPTGRAMMYMACVFAQLERETISERVKDNMFYLAKKGYWLGGTFPLGYTSKRVSKNGHSYCHLVQQENEIYRAKKIYSLFLEYGTISAVKKKLEEYGIYSRQGNVFSRTALKQILTNPVYCQADHYAREYFLKNGAEVTFLENQCSSQYGLMVYNKRNYSQKSAPRQDIACWIVALGKQKGIIKGEIWVSIQHRLQRNSSKSKQHKTENDYALLSGILYCGKCGMKMQPKKRRNSEKFDYICKGKLQKNGCTIQNLAGKETDSQTEQYLMEYIQKQNHFLEVWQKWKKQNIKYDTKELLYYQKQKQIYIDLLAKQYENDILIQDISQKIEQLQKQQYDLQQKKILWEKNQQQLKNSSFYFLWNKMTVRQKQEAIRFLIQKGVWDGEKLQYFL